MWGAKLARQLGTIMITWLVLMGSAYAQERNDAMSSQR